MSRGGYRGRAAREVAGIIRDAKSGLLLKNGEGTSDRANALGTPLPILVIDFPGTLSAGAGGLTARSLVSMPDGSVAPNPRTRSDRRPDPHPSRPSFGMTWRTSTRCRRWTRSGSRAGSHCALPRRVLTSSCQRRCGAGQSADCARLVNVGCGLGRRLILPTTRTNDVECVFAMNQRRRAVLFPEPCGG
jgi:hypothetical protein